MSTNKWASIATAPKDRPILVNCTGETAGIKYGFARWMSHPEWEGWVFDDEIMMDTFPLGPEPTHWFDISEPPKP